LYSLFYSLLYLEIKLTLLVTALEVRSIVIGVVRHIQIPPKIVIFIVLNKGIHILIGISLLLDIVTAVIIMAQPAVHTVVVVEHVMILVVVLVVVPAPLVPISLLPHLIHMCQEVGHVHVQIVVHIHKAAINVIQDVRMGVLTTPLNLLMLVQ
jgi:hypothetical protein